MILPIRVPDLSLYSSLYSRRSRNAKHPLGYTPWHPEAFSRHPSATPCWQFPPIPSHWSAITSWPMKTWSCSTRAEAPPTGSHWSSISRCFSAPVKAGSMAPICLARCLYGWPNKSPCRCRLSLTTAQLTERPVLTADGWRRATLDSIRSCHATTRPQPPNSPPGRRSIPMTDTASWSG